MEKRPQSRYPNTRCLTDELDRFLQHEPILAKRAGPLRRTWNWAQRHPWALAGWSSILILALACLAFGFWQNHQRFVWFLGHPGSRVPSSYYSPVLTFWVWLFPLACLTIYFGGSCFRRRFGGHASRRGPFYKAAWCAYLLLGLAGIGSGVWALFNLVTLAVWLRDALSVLTAIATAPWTLCLAWLGAHTLWEAAGAHESSLFGGLVDQGVERYLRYHPNRWTLWEIITCTLAILLSYGLTVAWLNRLTEELAGPGRVFEPPFVANFAVAAILYPAALAAFSRSRRLHRAAFFVALLIALSGLAISGRSGFFATPGAPANAPLWSGRILDFTVEKWSMTLAFPVVFLFTAILFERTRDRLKLLRSSIGLMAGGLAMVFAGLIAAAFSAHPFTRDDATLYFLSGPAAMLLAYPAIILRSRLGAHSLDRKQLHAPLISLPWLWQFRYGMLGAVLLLFAAVKFENWRGAEAWREAQAAWVAQGQPASYAALIPPPVQAKENFWKATIVQSWIPLKGSRGALPIPSLPRSTFESLGPIPYDMAALQELPESPPAHTPGAPSLTGLHEWFAQWDESFDALRQAAALPYAQLDAPPSNLAAGYFLPELAPAPDLVRIRVLAQVLTTRARVHLLIGQTQEAYGDMRTLLGLMRGLESTPVQMLSAMIRVGIGRLYVDTIRQSLDGEFWSLAELEQLQRDLEAMDLVGPVSQAMITERNARCELMERFACAPLHVRLKAAYLGEDIVLGTFLTGWTRQNQATISRLIAPTVQSFASGRISPDGIERAQEAAVQILRPRVPYNLLAKFNIPNWTKAAQTTAKNQTKRDLAVVALALTRYRQTHGADPETLDALVPQFAVELPRDVTSGSAYRYERIKADSFKLYALGWNCVDDGGIESENNELDWVW